MRHALRLSVRAFAEQLGVAARTVSKWEQLGIATTPLPDTQAILDTALSRANHEVKLRFDALLAGQDFATSRGSVDDVRRRTLLGLVGPIAVSPVAARLEELRRGIDGLLVAEPADRDADSWEQTVSDYAREVGKRPAESLLPDLVVDFAEIQAILTRATGPVRTSLLHCAARLAALTAIALVNSGEGHAAQRWWRTAARVASDTSDPSLEALIRGRHAVFSLSIAPAERVLDLAEAAIAASSRPCVGVISGLAAQAQALAMLGWHDDAVQALRSVIDMYTRLPAAVTADSASQWNWSEQRLRHVESHIHTHAGRVSEAGRAQDAALAAYPLANFQGRTQIETHRATTLVRAGDVELGVRHLVATLERLEPWQRRDGIVLCSAISTLEAVPVSRRESPTFQQARELVRG